jgi:hypothetical protein
MIWYQEKYVNKYKVVTIVILKRNYNKVLKNNKKDLHRKRVAINKIKMLR